MALLCCSAANNLGPYDSCNLGSINLAKYLTNENQVDWPRLRDHPRDTILDNTIDMNKYVIPKLKNEQRQLTLD